MIKKIIVSVLLIFSLTQAKQLSKAEIKSIIINASKNKKYSTRSSVKKHKLQKVKSYAKSTPAKVRPDTQKKPKKIVTKKIVPFYLPKSYERGKVSFNEKGFVLIKGAKNKGLKNAKNPLYKL